MTARRAVLFLAGAVLARVHGGAASAQAPGNAAAQAPGDAAAPVPGEGRAPRLPPVILSDHEGRRWPFAELARRRPVAVSFFFTGCTTLCPPQTMAMANLQEELGRRIPLDGESSPLLLSVSLDPLGDTPQAMQDYAGQFGLSLGPRRGWLLLTGEPQALARVWAAFEAAGNRPEDHTAMLWLGQPGGRRWRRASALAAPETLADLLLRGTT